MIACLAPMCEPSWITAVMWFLFGDAELYAKARGGAAALALRNVGLEQVAHLIIEKNGQRKGPLVHAGTHGKTAL